MNNYTIKLAYAKQLENEWNKYDGSCDPEEYLIGLQVDIEGALEEKFGASDDNYVIASEAIYGPLDIPIDLC